MKLVKIIVLVLVCFQLFSCKEPQARMPISHSSGTFMKESVDRNKILIAKEEKAIQKYIKNDTTVNYLSTKKGFWYGFSNKVENDSILPKRGDFVKFEYEVSDLNDNPIYTKEELGEISYTVDKQNIMSGLREAIKLMHKSESATFLFPSHLGFGYHGDNKKIGTNLPLVCKVTLLDIKKETKTPTNK